MVPRISRSLPTSAILTAVLALLAPQAVRADLEVTFQQDAGAATTIADNPVDFSSVFFNGTYGNFKVTVFGAASDNATPTSDLMSSTTSIKNTDTVAHTITIGVTQDNYTLPGMSGTLLDMTSHIGGTVTSSGAGQKLSFQSYANNSNGLFDTTGAVTTGAQSPDISVTKSSFDSSPDPSAPFPRTSSLYSVTTYNKITLAPGGVINFSTTTTLELPPAATPAPASLVLALTALPALGLGTWVRRRFKKAAAC